MTPAQNPLFRPILIGFVVLFAISAGCKRKTAEERGKAAADERAGFIKGVGDSLQSKGREAAQSIGGGLVKVWGGLNEGVANALDSQVQLSEDMTALGMQVTRVQLTSKGVVNAYVITPKPLQQRLCLRALDKAGHEVGRAVSDVDFPADHSGFVDFNFDERTPMSTVVSFALSLRPAEPVTAPATPPVGEVAK